MRPESLQCEGAHFAALLAYTHTTLAELAQAFGAERTLLGLIDAGDYVRALVVEFEAHGDIRLRLGGVPVEHRCRFISEVEPIALGGLARSGFMPSTLAHLRLLACRVRDIEADEPDYVERVLNQLAAAEAARAAREMIDAVQVLSRGRS